MCLVYIAFLQRWYQSRNVLHICPILLTNKHTEQEINVGQHYDQEAVNGDVRIKSEDNDSSQVPGAAYNP